MFSANTSTPELTLRAGLPLLIRSRKLSAESKAAKVKFAVEKSDLEAALRDANAVDKNARLVRMAERQGKQERQLKDQVMHLRNQQQRLESKNMQLEAVLAGDGAKVARARRPNDVASRLGAAWMEPKSLMTPGGLVATPAGAPRPAKRSMSVGKVRSAEPSKVMAGAEHGDKTSVAVDTRNYRHEPARDRTTASGRDKKTVHDLENRVDGLIQMMSGVATELNLPVELPAMTGKQYGSHEERSDSADSSEDELATEHAAPISDLAHEADLAVEALNTFVSQFEAKGAGSQSSGKKELLRFRDSVNDL